MPFTYRRRIHFHETDMAGIVHFSRFFPILEEAEQAFYREGIKISVQSVFKQGYIVPRVHAECDYLNPLFADDVVDVDVSVDKIGLSSLSMVFDIKRGEDAIAKGKIVAVYVKDGKSVDIPDEIRERSQAYLIKS